MKRTLQIALLAVVVASIVWLVAKQVLPTRAVSDARPTSMEQNVMVYYFHRTARCMTCMKIETLAKKEVETSFASEIKSGKVTFLSVNVESPGNEHFVTDYSLVSQSLVLVDRRPGRASTWKDLDQIWDLIHEPTDFTRYVHDEVKAFLEIS